MAYIVVAYIVMTYTFMAHTVMAYMVVTFDTESMRMFYAHVLSTRLRGCLINTSYSRVL